jgi:outer membrane protein assembly factor BamB
MVRIFPRPSTTVVLAFVFVLVQLRSGSLAAAADWVQWRGPDRTCRVGELAAWPDKLDESVLKPMFRVPLGPSYSGPIVAGDRVFVTETVDRKMEVVRALNRTTGEEIWKAEWPGAMSVPFFAAANGSWIRATPAWDGQKLYVAGMLDVLVALDGATGSETWRIDFAKEFGSGVESFGFVCSPLVDQGHVYVQTGGGLAKVRCDTGAVVWRSLKEEGGMMGGAFSSPIISTLASQRQLVVQTRSKLAGVDLESGSELWSVEIPSFRGMNILTPTILGDRIFTSSYGGGSFLFEVTRSPSGFATTEIWKKTTEAYMSSPVVVDQKIFVHLRNQRFTCIDSASGESLWTSKPFGKYWSIAVSGTRLLVLDERGDLLLVEASADEYRQLDSRHVSDSSTWAHVAVSDGQVFVRELDGLAVFRWK